jgi:hypothetical protein
VIAIAEIKRLAQGGNVVMRQAAMRVLVPGGARMHAVPAGRVSALCGFIPATGEWLDVDPAIGPGTCRACHTQLQRAGFSVSFAGRISPAERAS